MNISLHLDDSAWQKFFSRLGAALGKNADRIKRSFLIIWPREAAQHFDREEGPDGHWARWKESTARARLLFEIRTAISKQHAGGRLTNKQKERGAAKAADKRANLYAQGIMSRAGGKILQVSGRLRQETINEPLFESIPSGLKVYSPTPYSGYLDEGTENMEARPFMWLGDEAQENLSQVFLDSLWADSEGGA